MNCDYHLLFSRHFAKPCLTVINLPLIALSSTVDSRELESSREIEKVSSYLACSGAWIVECVAKETARPPPRC